MNEQHLTDTLHTISGYYTASHDPTLTPKTSNQTRSNNPSNPLPGSTSWMSWRVHCRDILALWADDFHRYLAWTTPIDHTPEMMCKWIINALPTLKDHPALDDFTAEMQTLERAAKYHAGETTPVKIELQCPAVWENQADCNATLQIRADMQPAEQVTCRKCGASWTWEQLEHIAENDSGQGTWLDYEAAAAYAGRRGHHITDTTIRSWVNRDNVAGRKGRVELASLKRYLANRSRPPANLSVTG